MALFGDDHNVASSEISEDNARLLGNKGSETPQNEGQRAKVIAVVDLSCLVMMFPLPLLLYG